MLQAEQLAHQRFVPPNPLVLGRKPRKSPTPAPDRDRPVSRRSKPSSRTAFIGEQPNPWELLHPQDAMSRHRTVFHGFSWRRLCLHPAAEGSGKKEVGRGKRIPPSAHASFPRALAVCDRSRRIASIGRRLWAPLLEASPFGSVVTGSTMSSSIAK
jgi:hypothetical protein